MRKLFALILCIVIVFSGCAPPDIPISIESLEDWGQVNTDVRIIACGSSHSLVILGDGSLYTWGLTDSEQIDSRRIGNSSTPFKIMSGVMSIAAGGDHTLAVKADDSLWHGVQTSSNRLK